MKVKIKIKPDPKVLAKQFLGAEKKLARRLWEGLTAYAFLIERNAKLVTPRDTSSLANSIKTAFNPRKFQAIIEPKLIYSRWIHEGWMRRGGKIIYLLGMGRAGTPFGGKPYMDLGAKDSEVQGNRIISAKISQAIREL